MTRRTLLTLGCLALLLGATRPVLAGPILFDVRFTTDNVGTAPATAASVAGVTNTRPTFVNVIAPSASALVQNSYTDSVTSTSFGGKVAVLTDLDNSSGATDLRFLAHASDVVSTGKVTVQWTMMVESNSGVDAGNWLMTLRNSSGSEIAGWQLNTPSKNIAIRGYTDAGLGTFAVTNMGSSSPGQVVHWELELDYATGLQTLKKNHQVLGSAYFLYNQNYREMRVGGGGATAGIIAIDNVMIALPEPGSLLLGSAAALFLGVSRPRRKAL